MCRNLGKGYLGKRQPRAKHTSTQAYKARVHCSYKKFQLQSLLQPYMLRQQNNGVVDSVYEPLAINLTPLCSRDLALRIGNGA